MKLKKYSIPWKAVEYGKALQRLVSVAIPVSTSSEPDEGVYEIDHALMVELKNAARAAKKLLEGEA